MPTNEFYESKPQNGNDMYVLNTLTEHHYISYSSVPFVRRTNGPEAESSSRPPAGPSVTGLVRLAPLKSPWLVIGPGRFLTDFRIGGIA